VHNGEDEPSLICHVNAPILISPDFPGMLLEEVADKPCDLGSQDGRVLAVSQQRFQTRF
jgi:hypothetical protein